MSEALITVVALGVILLGAVSVIGWAMFAVDLEWNDIETKKEFLLGLLPCGYFVAKILKKYKELK